MLLSHVCKFIYLKTRKTAGTSVEIYFEPYCVDPKNYSGERHGRAAEVSEWGIVGSRRMEAGSPWYNHMPAEEIRNLTGRDVWDAYYKFCVIRNPFDKVVSYFWHEAGLELGEQFRAADFAAVRQSFAAWTERKSFPDDRFIYTIADVPVVRRDAATLRAPEYSMAARTPRAVQERIPQTRRALRGIFHARSRRSRCGGFCLGTGLLPIPAPCFLTALLSVAL
jgi:hypothetical protein